MPERCSRGHTTHAHSSPIPSRRRHVHMRARAADPEKEAFSFHPLATTAHYSAPDVEAGASTAPRQNASDRWWSERSRIHRAGAEHACGRGTDIEGDSLLWYLSGRPGQPAPTDRSRWVTGHRGFCDRSVVRPELVNQQSASNCQVVCLGV